MSLLLLLVFYTHDLTTYTKIDEIREENNIFLEVILDRPPEASPYQ
jgi:hypothetical protein